MHEICYVHTDKQNYKLFLSISNLGLKCLQFDKKKRNKKQKTKMLYMLPIVARNLSQSL